MTRDRARARREPSWGVGDFLGGLSSRGVARPHRARALAARRLRSPCSSGSRSPGTTSLGGARRRRGDRRRARAARSASARSTAGWRSARWGSWRRSRACPAVIPFAVGSRRASARGRSRSSATSSRSAASRSSRGSRASTAAASRPASGSRCSPALGFGLYFVFLDGRRTTACRGASSTRGDVASPLALAAVLALGVGRAPRRGASCPRIVAVGALRRRARTCSSALATTRGLVSVVSVLTSLYPVVTVALAAVVLRERIAPAQRVGVGGALGGAALRSLPARRSAESREAQARLAPDERRSALATAAARPGTARGSAHRPSSRKRPDASQLAVGSP